MQAQHWSKFRTFGLVQPGLFAVNFCQIFGVNFGQIFQIALHEELWTWGADLVASAAHAHTDQRVARLHGVPDEMVNIGSLPMSQRAPCRAMCSRIGVMRGRPHKKGALLLPGRARKPPPMRNARAQPS